jgi:hypothetical protein
MSQSATVETEWDKTFAHAKENLRRRDSCCEHVKESSITPWKDARVGHWPSVPHRRPLRNGGGRLPWKSMPGLVTEEIRSKLLQLKPEILELLRAEAAAPPQFHSDSTVCEGCRQFALSRPGLLCFWCRQRSEESPAGGER